MKWNWANRVESCFAWRVETSGIFWSLIWSEGKSMEDFCSILLAACFWTFSITEGDPPGNNLHQTKYVILDLVENRNKETLLVMWCGCHYASRIIASTTPLWLSTTVRRRCCTSMHFNAFILHPSFFLANYPFSALDLKRVPFSHANLWEKKHKLETLPQNTDFFWKFCSLIHLVPSRGFLSPKTGPNGRTISCWLKSNPSKCLSGKKLSNSKQDWRFLGEEKKVSTWRLAENLVRD